MKTNVQWLTAIVLVAAIGALASWLQFAPRAPKQGGEADRSPSSDDEPLPPPLPLDPRIAALMTPEEDLRYTQVDWHLDLLEAQARARRTRKPLFMWLMDGHPLAAT